MRALVSPRTPRSHHPGCPLLLPATRPDLQAEHPAAPSAELGGGTGAAERGCVRRGGTNGAAAPPRCHYNSAAPEQECAAGALEPNYPNYVDLPSRCELCRRRPRAATRTNVCLSCKKGAGAFLPPYSPQQPYFGNEKSLLSHPDITCGAQRRRGRVTDGDHTAMDAHRSQQGPTRGSARTIRLCVPLLGSPRPPQRRLPSFPSTALGQLRSPSHQLGSIGSQRIPGSKPSWRSTEPTGRAFTAPLPAAHPEQSFGGTPPPPASAPHGPVSQPNSCCTPPRSYSDNRLHFHAAQTHTAPGRQISRDCPPCCQVRPAGEVCLSLLPAGEAQHCSAPHLHRELPLSPTDPSARSGHRMPSHSRVEGLIARDGTQSLGEHRENLHSPEQQRSWAAIPIGRAPRALLGAAPHGLSAGAALPGSHFPAESGCTLCSEGRYPQQSVSVGWRGRISPWGCSGVSAALWVLCAVGVRPPARSRAGDTRTARCSRTDRFGV